MIFLPCRDCSPQALEEEPAQKTSNPAFRALLEWFISEGWASVAMSEVNVAVSNLLTLWVGLYLTMPQ